MTAAAETPRRRPGGVLLIESLRRHGVDRIFSMPGESFLPVLDALHDHREIQVVLCRHEGAGANMAEADGKLTGRPGICLVTRGPGATHASIGIHTAAQDSTPMILFVGQVPRPFLGREAFQEIDYVRFFSPIAKWAVQVEEAARIPEIVARAFHVAMSGRPGPVVVAIPEDVQREEAAPFDVAPIPPSRPGASPAEVSELARLLAAAERPLMLLGGSTWTAEACENMARFARRQGVPVTVGFRRQGIFDHHSPQFAGHLAPGINPKLAERVKASDLIVAVGTRLGEFTTGGYKLLAPPATHAKLVHVHPSAEELGKLYRPVLAIPSDVEPVAALLAELTEAANPPWGPWAASARQDYEAFSTPAINPDENAPLRTTELMAVAEQRMPPDAIVTNGAGNYSIWLHRFHRYRRFGSQLAPTSGAMGYALPAAIAAKLRQPERPVVCFTGDGDFMMYPQELIAVAEHRLQMVVVVVNNGRLGTIRMHQERVYPGRVCATDLANPDFAALARSFGVAGATARTVAGFRQAFEAALAAPGATVIDAQVDPADLTPDRRL
jgi:acetolactate synthase-1/2/3 large subunit